MYAKQMTWKIKPPLDSIFTRQQLHQKLLESDNYCKNYSWWLGGILFGNTVQMALGMHVNMANAICILFSPS